MSVNPAAKQPVPAQGKARLPVLVDLVCQFLVHPVFSDMRSGMTVRPRAARAPVESMKVFQNPITYIIINILGIVWIMSQTGPTIAGCLKGTDCTPEE